MLTKLRHALRRRKTDLWRKLGWLGGDWTQGVQAEIHFWKNALQNPEKNWSLEAFDFRLNPGSPFQTELQKLLEPSKANIKVLDVGAGPLTSLGKVWPGHTIEIVATDPLAPQYDDVLAALNIKPPVRTIYGKAEELDELFEEGSFDLAYSSNALDHANDPLRAIMQMLRTVRPGGWVYLWHFANEGTTEAYHGLHQWNFDVRNDDFTISDGRADISLRSKFANEVELHVGSDRAFGKKVVIARIRKL